MRNFFKRMSTRKGDALQTENMKSLGDCILLINQNKSKRAFSANLEIVLNQIKRFQSKKESIREMLLQKFTATEMSYAKFYNAVEELEKVMYLNIKGMLNKIGIVDDTEYRQLKIQSLQNKNLAEAAQSRLEIYDQYVEFVNHAVADNEQILLKMDQLLAEVTKFNMLDGEIENVPAMQEIDQLIHDAKWYR